MSAISPEEIAYAAAKLRGGDLVAFPTETVYGLGADATNDHAVASIFKAKGRPEFNPLIAHVVDRAAAERQAVFNQDAATLTEAYWPGPLTLVLPKRPDCTISMLALCGLDTVALRCPAAAVAQALLTEVACPVAAPSANRSGRLSPTTAQHVANDLDGKVNFILDGGPCPIGVESTIVDLSVTPAVLLRPGAITREDIATIIDIRDGKGDAHVPKAPGQLLSHYAPHTPLRLNATGVDTDEALLAFARVSWMAPLSCTISAPPAISPKLPPISSPCCTRSTITALGLSPSPRSPTMVSAAPSTTGSGALQHDKRLPQIGTSLILEPALCVHAQICCGRPRKPCTTSPRARR